MNSLPAAMETFKTPVFARNNKLLLYLKRCKSFRPKLNQFPAIKDGHLF